MPIIDEKRRDAGRMVLVMLKEAGTVALYNDDDVVYCFDCMFKNHSHKVANFWKLDNDDMAKNGKLYICDDCGKQIN